MPSSLTPIPPLLPVPSATPHLRDLLEQQKREAVARSLREHSAAWAAAQAFAPPVEWPEPAGCSRDWACYLADGHRGGCCRD